MRDHDLTAPLDGRVECLICHKGVVVREAYTISTKYGVPLKVHGDCLRGMKLGRLEALYRAAHDRLGEHSGLLRLSV